MSFASCLADALARGDITQEEHDEYAGKFRATARGIGGEAARSAIQKELDIQAEMAQRRRMLDVEAMDRLVKDLGQFRTAAGKKDLMRAAEALFEDFGYAGYPSVRFIGEALIGHFHSEMAEFLDHFARKTFWSNASVVGGRQNKADMADVQKALFGETAPPVAQGLAQAATHVMEMARQLFNRYAGDTIPKLEDWGGPQSHNSDAVIRAGGFKGKPAEARQAWGKFIDPLLNWEKIRDPFTGEPFGKIPPPDRRNAILGHAWDTIVTDGLIDRAPAARRVAGQSVATSRSDHRFFVFKDAESKNRYNVEFGAGDFFNQIMDHIHGMARDIALMQRFGPNPAARLEWIKQQIDLEAAKAATGKPSLIEGYRNTEVLAKAQAAKNTLDGYYEQYRGARAAQGWMTLAGTILRNNSLGSLLGSSVIAHTSSNWLIQTFARKLGGIPAANVIPEVLTSFQRAAKDEILRAGLDVENGMCHLGSGARQMGALAKAANWSRWLPDRTTNLTGLIAVVDANKAATYRGIMSHLADMQGTDWESLPAPLKRKLVGYGLRKPDWQMAQMAQQYRPVVGSAGWLTPRAIYDLARTRPVDVLRAFGRTDLAQFMPDRPSGLSAQAEATAERLAHESMLKLFGYMHGEREVAVPQHSMRMKQAIQGRQSGNQYIDALRQSAGMFKGFVGSMMLTQAQARAHMWARSKIGATAYLAAFVASMTLMGMLTLQLKQLAAGKDALPMNPFTRAGMQNWARAILTSSSFGIYGDFLASDVDSYGRGVLETLAGPAVMLPIDAATGAWDMAQGRLLGGKQHKKPISEVASDTTLRFLKGNTPMLSTAWYARAAFQRILLDGLQYEMDREAHVKQRRSEDRLRKETGQYMWWRPGEVLPSRAPRLVTTPPP